MLLPQRQYCLEEVLSGSSGNRYLEGIGECVRRNKLAARVHILALAASHTCDLSQVSLSHYYHNSLMVATMIAAISIQQAPCNKYNKLPF